METYTYVTNVDPVGIIVVLRYLYSYFFTFLSFKNPGFTSETCRPCYSYWTEDLKDNVLLLIEMMD